LRSRWYQKFEDYMSPPYWVYRNTFAVVVHEPQVAHHG